MVDLKDGNYVDNDGDTVWVQNGTYHRSDGPALIRACGQKQWRQHGCWHRTDGPAITTQDGEMLWWLNDTRYSFEKWLQANTEITDEEKVMLKLKYG